MKKNIKLAAVSLALALAGSVHAETFDAVQNSHFTDTFAVTVTKDNGLVVSLFGSTTQFKDLAFDFVTVAGFSQSVAAPLVNPPAQISVSYSDIRNKFGDGTVADFHLAKGTYTLKVTGDTLSDLTGGHGTYTLNTINASAVLTPVPEPETYAMLLAGLGMIGAMVRRRKASKA
jgi:type III secretory pathway component EscS